MITPLCKLSSRSSWYSVFKVACLEFGAPNGVVWSPRLGVREHEDESLGCELRKATSPSAGHVYVCFPVNEVRCMEIWRSNLRSKISPSWTERMASYRQREVCTAGDNNARSRLLRSVRSSHLTSMRIHKLGCLISTYNPISPTLILSPLTVNCIQYI